MTKDKSYCSKNFSNSFFNGLSHCGIVRQLTSGLLVMGQKVKLYLKMVQAGL